MLFVRAQCKYRTQQDLYQLDHRRYCLRAVAILAYVVFSRVSDKGTCKAEEQQPETGYYPERVVLHTDVGWQVGADLLLSA